jgi:hypothetical protein
MCLVCRGSLFALHSPRDGQGEKFSDEPATGIPGISKPASAFDFRPSIGTDTPLYIGHPTRGRAGAGAAHYSGGHGTFEIFQGRTVVVTDGESAKNNGPAPGPKSKEFRPPADAR